MAKAHDLPLIDRAHRMNDYEIMWPRASATWVACDLYILWVKNKLRLFQDANSAAISLYSVGYLIYCFSTPGFISECNLLMIFLKPVCSFFCWRLLCPSSAYTDCGVWVETVVRVVLASETESGSFSIFLKELDWFFEGGCIYVFIN